MFIKSLTLNNIRSYKQLKIDFSLGITLLAGDIGCGKTTILIALEFALFGILRGKTSPAELLRHGEKQGSVTLDCEIDNKDIIITRSLKRSGSTILQSAGSLSIDGTSYDLVATELKAKILELLGYPESLLSKSTNLFRYTVYTPQEQVKLILHETVEERKDIIRKIFNIDKYKTVAENASFYQSDLRNRVERFKGQLDDFKTLKEQLNSQERELVTIKNMLPPAQKSYEIASTARIKAEEVLQNLRKKGLEREEMQKKMVVIKTSIEGDNQLKNSYLLRQKALLSDVEKPLKDVSFDKEKLGKVEEVLLKLRDNFVILNKKFGELKAKKEIANDTSITSLQTCPTCKQPVTEEHKDHIKSIQKKQLDLIYQKESELLGRQKEFKEKEDILRKKLEVLRKQQQDFLLLSQEKKQLEIKKKELEQIKENITLQDEKISKLSLELLNLEKRVKELPIIKTDDEEEKLKLLRHEERIAENALVELKTKEKYSDEKLKSLTLEVTKKESVQKRVGELSNLRNWVVDLFIPLVSTIEKRVLYKVYQEFHTYFATWFSMLVEDDDLVVRLDEDFTPLIFQHGFDTTIENLSGGEKTSVALAYRLALNKVLNDYFGTLHTKGLLILDEPTDGFSSEQIDKLRDVLEQLGTNQLILVSHEQRLESLADNVIRVSKSNHESSIF